MGDRDSSMVRLTGLWWNDSQRGTEYLAGSISPSSKLIILPNPHKEKESDPDYIAYIATPEKEGKDKPDRPRQGSFL